MLAEAHQEDMFALRQHRRNSLLNGRNARCILNLGSEGYPTGRGPEEDHSLAAVTEAILLLQGSCGAC